MRITKYLKAKRRRSTPVWQYHVWSWLNRDRRAPDWAVLAIEDATGVSRHDLRPDIYPREEAA